MTFASGPEKGPEKDGFQPHAPPRPVTGFDLEHSIPGDYSLPRPASGAPNVVMIVLDDMGFAELGCFGSTIDTPHMDRLAANGLRYNRFHVTALCSPTRACLLTGRNHHAVGMGWLTDVPFGFPGYTARVPKSAATLPRLLREAGYNTMAVGKWHLTPSGERSHAGPFDRWPLGFGFERYYGFLGGGTNQWTPDLACDNHFVDPPGRPEDGYHLSEDLATTAIRYLQDQKHAAPTRPFFLYFPLGAMHAPHHVSQEWIARYRGHFDGGWDREREETFARQRELGIVPDDTVLLERPPWVQDWATLDADERTVYARMQEVYAGFLSHTDAQIGRIIAHLESIGELDNTIVMVLSDNGASAEGGLSGLFNVNRFAIGPPETISENLARLDEFGGFRSYNHYPWGWAWSGNTPLRLWKRFTWLGGTRTPLIVHWPSGFSARGAVRTQFVHAIDLMPTLLETCGVTSPDVLDGVSQQPIDGASIHNTFHDGDAPDPREVQYFEIMGSRSIISHGWKATTDHYQVLTADEERVLPGSHEFATDRWSLFNLRDDFAETRDVADANPEVLASLKDEWLIEAARNQVFPLVGSSIAGFVAGRVGAMVAPANGPAARSVFRPGTSPVPTESIPSLSGGFRLTADVDIPETPEGILCALGDWSNGFAFYVKDRRLVFALNCNGELRHAVGDRTVPTGTHLLVCRYHVDAAAGATLTLLHDDDVVASVAIDVTVRRFHGTALCLGYDQGFPVCDDYSAPFSWNGGLHRVTVEVGDMVQPEPDEERRHALHTE